MMKHWMIGLVVLIGCILQEGAAYGQSSILERKISLGVQNASVAEVLKATGEQAGCTFSYAGGVIQLDQTVNIEAYNKSVRDVLYQIFGSSIQCTERKNIIVLTKAKRKENSTTSGYVQDKKGEPIVNATVYDPVQLNSVRTNEYGYFQIRIHADSMPPLLVKKENYNDTLLGLKPVDTRLQYITMNQKDTTWYSGLEQWPDSLRLSLLRLGQWTKDQVSQLTEIRNVHDSLNRHAQVSLLPMLGTNGRLSGNVGNDWSFNVIGGVNGEVRAAELGGVFNINRGNVRYFQMAGVLNAVDGHVVGTQWAGVANMVEGSVKGVQMGGVLNLNADRMKGFQCAGAMNLNRKGFDGFSAAGCYNDASDTSNGIQMAGVLNRAGIIRGVQISGFMNIAHKVKGVQIGVINRADSVQGAVIGFLSFVKSGYHQLATYYDELGYAGVQWRTGTHFFYNLIEAGVRIDPVHGKTHFAYGYGIGVSTNNRKPWIWNNDFTVHHYLPGKWTQDQHYVGRWYSGVEKRFGRIFALSCGLTANVHAFNAVDNGIAFPFPSKDFIWSESHTTGYSYATWLGWRVGVRFNLNPPPRRM